MPIKPSKKLGQNFLADKKVLDHIIEAANISGDDIILEIGPGQGSLTYALCKAAKKVIAVEKDERLYNYLIKKFEKVKNAEFVNEDILKFIESGIMNYELRIKEYKVVANIPYYLTSFLLRKIFELKNKPSEIILMVQKEVAERITERPGEMSILAISVQIFAEPEILFYVSKNSFWPKPKVDSAVIRIKIKNEKPKIKNMDDFFMLVKTGFSAKRKLLANNLTKGLNIEKEKIYDIFRRAEINANARAQDLSINEWQKLYKAIYGRKK